MALRGHLTERRSAWLRLVDSSILRAGAPRLLSAPARACRAAIRNGPVGHLGAAAPRPDAAPRSPAGPPALEPASAVAADRRGGCHAAEPGPA